jgi:hypothetical protein
LFKNIQETTRSVFRDGNERWLNLTNSDQLFGKCCDLLHSRIQGFHFGSIVHRGFVFIASYLGRMIAKRWQWHKINRSDER